MEINNITSDKNMSYLTAKNFAVSKEILQDASKFATHTGASDGEGKSDIIDALIDLKTNKNVMSFRGASASEFLQGVLTDITLAKSHAKLFKDNYSNLQSSIETQRQSISGVDKDEEAINLVKYQKIGRAYV